MTPRAMWAWLLGALALVACASRADRIAGATDAAEVRCEDGTHVQGDAVRAQPDGVHFAIDNRIGQVTTVYVRLEDDVAAVKRVDPGTSEVVMIASPGSWDVVCMTGHAYPGEGAAWVGLEVVDPDGHWVSDVLDCEQIAASHPDYREDFEGGTPTGQQGDPIELAREWIEGGGFPVDPHDVVEPAGYPGSEFPLVRLVRGGQVVAIARYQPDGQGGWIDRGVEYCEAA